MNDLSQNSQGHSVPKSKSERLTAIIGFSLDNHIDAVKSNLFKVSIAHDEFKASENPDGVIEALNAMSIYHLNAVKNRAEEAITIYNFPEYLVISKVANHLICAIESQISPSMKNGKDIDSSYLYGLYSYADELQEAVQRAWSVTNANKEKING